MNIGFDLDGIFIDKPPFIPNRLIDWLYRDKKSKTLAYRIPSAPEQMIRKVSHLTIFRPQITKNVSFIKKAYGKNKHQYYLISSRFGFLEKETEKILKKHQLINIFKEKFINFNNQQPHLFKSEVIKKLKLDCYIDDDLPLISFVAKKNPKIKFFWLNKKTKALSKNIFAVKSLNEIIK